MSKLNPDQNESGITSWERVQGAPPRGHLLSNGRYRVLLTAAGSGFSECAGLALTRWRGDRVEDADGMFIYLRDLDRGQLWSAGHQPVLKAPDHYEATFTDGRATFTRKDDGIESILEVAVIPDRDAELRRLTLRNDSNAPRRIEVTTYLEAVLNHREADSAHPAFSKLFVQTEWCATTRALLARRRPRGGNESPRWMFHWISQNAPEGLSYESDRARFLGRGRTAAGPQALLSTEPLSCTVGNVLDPVLALRCVLLLEPGEIRSITFGLGYADDREGALETCEQYSSADSMGQAFQASQAQARFERERLGIGQEEALSFTQEAVDLMYGGKNSFRQENNLGPGMVVPEPGGLLNGAVNLPILVVIASGTNGAAEVEGALRAHAYWTRLGFRARIAFLGSKGNGEISGKRGEGHRGESPGAGLCTFIDTDHWTAEARLSILWHASLILGGAQPWTGEPPAPTSARPTWYRPLRGDSLLPMGGIQTLLNNGRGGFSPDGQEYIIQVDPLPDGLPDLPPMPWSNVIANETFGFLTTERGPSCTWNRNSRLHRLTPWLNDPVSDPLPEAFFLRDEDAREYWSPTPGPVGNGLSFTVRHGFGYTRWESLVKGLEQEITTFVPLHEPLKLTRVKLRNTGAQRRRLTLFWYAHLVLGETPEVTAGHVCSLQEDSSLFAWNVVPSALGSQVAFAAVVPAADIKSFTTDRDSFLGRQGSLECPGAVLGQSALDGTTGPAQEPCFAFQVELDLEPGETRECVIVFGEAVSQEAAQRLVRNYSEVPAAQAALDEVHAFWRGTLSGVQIQTPEPALDLMVNGWLPYQNLVCRMWGRTAYYQSGGAFGFRDQLQDSAALLYLLPDLTRRQILLNAAHQFVEGDVLHWWHPPIEQGIRTKFSDDLLWLPYLTAFYLQSTGDSAILAEQVPYLTARLLGPEEDEAFLAPKDSGEQGDLYDHCCRALDRSLGRMGAHGLPLMGTGDWNDGMNRVGRGGQGESVWLGFFLYTILASFVPICERRGDGERAARYASEKDRLARALDETSWDGEWYRRAYYDDGTPLGSAASQECRIDCLAQAWAVISKAVPEDRARKAMQAVEKHLIDDGAGMIRLLTPAFDVCDHDPGYIKGYIPGVRENGGQYTHGALWAVKATAEAGWTDRAAELLTMLSPASHARSAEGVATYQTEPYVVAADVYGVAPLIGRGGWTWYTGSAGWMYRVAIEDVLGFHLDGGHSIRLRPRLPSTWDHTTIRYRDPNSQSIYEIRVERDRERSGGILEAVMDAKALVPGQDVILVPLLPDGATHVVKVVIGA